MGGVCCAVSVDGVEVEGLEEGPLFLWGEKAVLCELIEGFETLHVYANSIHVALFCAVECVLFGETKSSEVAHCSFVFNIGVYLPERFFAVALDIKTTIAHSVGTVPCIAAGLLQPPP